MSSLFDGLSLGGQHNSQTALPVIPATSLVDAIPVPSPTHSSLLLGFPLLPQQTLEGLLAHGSSCCPSTVFKCWRGCWVKHTICICSLCIACSLCSNACSTRSLGSSHSPPAYSVADTSNAQLLIKWRSCGSRARWSDFGKQE